MPTSLPAPSVAERSALVAARLAELRALLARRGAGALLLDTRRDFAWLTLGGQNHVLYTSETGVAPVLVTAEDATVIAPVNERDRIADEEVGGLDFRVTSVPWWEPAATAASVKALARGRSILRAPDVATELESLRTALVPLEHRRMGWLADRLVAAANEAMNSVSPGTTENDVAADIMASLSTAGVRLPVVLAAADERIERYRHPIATDKPIQGRLMLVVVAERWGLHVAHTQFRELEPRATELQRRADALAEILSVMRAATVVGNTLGDVLEAAKAAYERAGMGAELSLHHQGGSIGYRARERIAVPTDRTPIRPGMAFAWNPSAVGFKREETVYLDDLAEQRVLTTTPD